jgi:hypothetical protein
MRSITIILTDVVMEAAAGLGFVRNGGPTPGTKPVRVLKSQGGLRYF